MTTRPAEETNGASGVEGLPSLYEREAFLVHTLAARITGDAAAAAAAVEEAFLALATLGGSPAERAVAAALPLAVPGPTAPPLRAALAVDALCEGGPAAVARALQLPAAAATAVLARARGELAASLGVAEDEAMAEYGARPWEAPPEELWPRVHERVFRALAEPQAPVPPQPAAVGRRRLTRPLVLLGFGVVCAAGGAAGAAWLSGTQAATGNRSAPAVAATRTPAPAVVPAGSMAPQDLDALRMDELRDLKRYARQAADRELAPGQRREASARLKRLAERAQRRRRAAERRARQRELAERRSAPPEATPEAPRAARPQTAPADDEETAVPLAEEPAPEAEAEPEPQPEDEQPSADREDCLYDEENEVYVCPGD